MECPKCKGFSKVINVKRVGHQIVWRRRKCKKCDHKFSTYERIGEEEQVEKPEKQSL